ncbi:MAG: tripartite tricarboxylate transporter TctB family protein [Dethiobacter sp.]|nr:tripartite tricarboxylate transporter TctB family protein [Dethiobacter sp.]
MKKGEPIFLIVLLVISIFMFVDSIKRPAIHVGQIGPGVWPAAVSGALIFIIISFLAANLLEQVRGKNSMALLVEECPVKHSIDIEQFENQQASKVFLKMQQAYIPVLVAVTIAVCIYLMNIIGFLFTVPIIIIAMIKIQKYVLNPLLLILIAVGSSILLSVFFGTVCHLYLARGIGFFREISYFIY